MVNGVTTLDHRGDHKIERDTCNNQGLIFDMESDGLAGVDCYSYI